MPSKTIPGIRNLRAVSAAHGRCLSTIMHVGSGSSRSNNCSNGCRSMFIATKNLLIKSGEVTFSSVSQPIGKPASAEGNGRLTRRTGRPEAAARSMVWWNLAAMRGVVMIVTVGPCWANNFAMSMIGMKWPGAIKGNRTK
ncbi:hypothetical protein Vadar_027157 [Vaccinium darrowii]|uniref:Uncharacterized protein n=1 Tax=Vaccinium darrowii TaxID=229202 RepID=A0ACB7XUA9_9ERIC|nr:hypothetical protein Vadar_027157 [Vaccinium darrowii]